MAVNFFNTILLGSLEAQADVISNSNSTDNAHYRGSQIQFFGSGGHETRVEAIEFGGQSRYRFKDQTNGDTRLELKDLITLQPAQRVDIISDDDTVRRIELNAFGEHIRLKPQTSSTEWRLEYDSDQFVVRDQTNSLDRFTVKDNGIVVQFARASAVVGGDLQASNISFYLDEGGNNLKVIAKYSNGSTVKTGTLALV